MLRVIALTALTAIAGGCTVNDPCADGTVLVSLTLDGAAAQADELLIDVALDGAAPHESSLAHAPGSASGNVVVQFPSGYPSGHSVAVGVVARASGVVVGEASVSSVLSASCEAVALTVEPATLDDGAVGDLAGDLAEPESADLAPPPDLAHCVPAAENCFNGIDDDCDGHIDCDDPDCTTIAVCVPPVTAPFVVGTTLDPVSLCPTSYSSLEVIDSGLTAAANCSTGCSCGVTCQTQIGSFGNFGNCPNTDNENQIAVLYNTMCQSFNTWDGTLDVHQLVTPASCLNGGNPVLPTVSWATSKRVCSTALHGGGCTGGNWCVPITPASKCEVAAGTQTCDAGYNAVGGPWYTGYGDTRGCSCSCGAPSGSCGTTVSLHSDTGCTSAATTFAATATNNITCSAGGPFHSGRIEITAPTCGAPTYNPETGALTPTGLQTLCCVP
jgi:hypothetical protein